MPRLGPIPRIGQQNELNFHQWLDLYNEQIKDLYHIIKKECHKDDLTIFNKMDFNTFVEFVYSYSNKRKPKNIHAFKPSYDDDEGSF